MARKAWRPEPYPHPRIGQSKNFHTLRHQTELSLNHRRYTIPCNTLWGARSLDFQGGADGGERTPSGSPLYYLLYFEKAKQNLVAKARALSLASQRTSLPRLRELQQALSDTTSSNKCCCRGNHYPLQRRFTQHHHHHHHRAAPRTNNRPSQ